MARATRQSTRSRSLGAGTRNDNSPGSRASASAQNIGQVAAGGAVAAEEAAVNRNQNNNREDQAVADLETMRVEQAQIRLEGRVPGYKGGDLLSP